MKKYAERISQLRAEGAYQVLAKSQALEKAGRDIVHFEVGQPDFETFENVTQAGIRSIQEGRTRYTASAGMMSLREAIAESAGRQRGLSFKPEQVIIGPGAKPGLFFPTLALVQPGDEVIYPDPGFPTYEAMIGVAGGVPVPVPLEEESDFSFDMEAFSRLVNPRTRLIILNSPGNPTGGVVPLRDLELIASAAQQHDAWVMSDEIYTQIVFDGLQAPSIAALPGMLERTIIVDGFSKTYAMTGWRLGYGIMPEGLAAKVELLIQHSVGCTAHFTQYAGLEALHGPQDRVAEVREIYQKRRDLIVAGLNKIPGVSCRSPQGAFYAFPNVKAFGKTSDELSDLLLYEAGVAVLPGSCFGKHGEGYLRLSYATSFEVIEKGLERIGAALGKLELQD